jgi:hypothetical protein
LIRAAGSQFAVLLLLSPSLLGAQVPSSGQAPEGDDVLTVSLVTIGQGDLVWERFGHNALLFQNRETGTEIAYHWGIFNFFSEDFIPRLIKGTMLYSMGPSDFLLSLAGYREAGRPVWIQELALTPAQERELLALVEENYLPENRDYRYDYYRDNCSTRLRDALDHVLDGKIEDRFAADTTAYSFRWHTRRVLQEMPVYYLGIQFVLGPRADRPITVWEEMFLPGTLHEHLGEIQVSDGRGGSRSLVSAEGEILASDRGPPPSYPPFALPLFFVVGLLWGGSLLILGRSGEGVPWWRRLGFLVLGGGWSLVAVLAGFLLLGAWLFTDHQFWYANWNLFQVNPLFLPLPLAFLAFLFGKGFPRWASQLALLLGALSFLGLLLELLPGLGQRNGEFLALAVPVNLGLCLSLRSLGVEGRGRAQEDAGS